MSKHVPYTEEEVVILKVGGKRLRSILELLGKECREGVTGKEIDVMAEKIVLENGDIPVFKNYKPHGAQKPFPATICISVNDVVAHGIPNDFPFKNGDAISLDLGFRHEGLVVDSAISIIVGSDLGTPLSKGVDTSASEVTGDFSKEQKLLDVTKKALEIGIQQCQVGNRVNAVGAAIEEYVVTQGMNVVDVLCGHAVGRKIHDDPQVPHADYGPGGPKIQEGMVLAIEPHISLGSGEVYLSSDLWAYKTTDRAKTAQFEHTILVTKDGPIILT
jgi:methionyl aminopeptidase